MKQIIGFGFSAMAGVLFGLRHVVAAIYMSGEATKSKELFLSGLRYTGNELLIAAGISLAIGIAFMIWGIISEKR